MESLFDPDSVVIIGASSDPNKPSGQPQRYLERHGFAGDVYPVNPNSDEIEGVPCYPDIESVPETPDLAVVIIPARFVLDVVEDTLSTGVKNVLIVTAGFAETGSADGASTERELSALADEYGANIVGPNSQGVINFRTGMTASYTSVLDQAELITGELSFVTQSGAFGGALTTMFQQQDIGLSKWIAMGNEACLESLDVVSYLASDPTTEVVAGYIEGFEDGRKLLELKRTAEGIDLPIVFLKVGRSERGISAAASHTGKVATSFRVYEGIFRETGVMLVDDIDDLFAVTESALQLDELPGRNVGVLSTSGGAGAHLADVADCEGLVLPQLATETSAAIRELIPPYASATNPVDVTDIVVSSRAEFAECADFMLDDDRVDTLVIQITNASDDRAVDYAERLTDILEDADKPVFVCWSGGADKRAGLDIYARANVPVFENPARCIRTVSRLVDFAESRPRLSKDAELPARLPATQSDGDVDAPSVLTETDGKALLAQYGLSVPDEKLLSAPDNVTDHIASLGLPLVAKLVSPELVHRNDVGGVRTNLRSSQAVEDAVASLFELGDELEVPTTGVSLQEMVPGGIEMSLGINVDPDFGPVLMFGRGGVEIEQVRDVTVRSIPVSAGQAAAMIDDLESVDETTFSASQREQLVDAITGLSELYVENRWIREADVNPVIVTEDDVVAVDALFYGPGDEDETP